LTSRDAAALLDDIVSSARLVLRYVDGVNFEEFVQNVEKQDAVLRRIQAIGEAATRLPPEVTAAIPTVPWRRVAGMRHFLVHEYWAVDLKLVWVVAQEEMQPLIAAVEVYRP
jgi:uncharacterized protein with HEPN domain